MRTRNASVSGPNVGGHRVTEDGRYASASPDSPVLELPSLPHIVGSSTFPESPHVRSMAKLRAFLFDQSAPWLFTVRDIRHRYTLWKSAGVLRDLRSEDLSALICLLGTSSASETRKPHASPHTHPRAFHMPKSASAPYWQFIERIGQDKRWLRYPLLPSDHYWLMRAALARVSEFMQTGETNWPSWVPKSLSPDHRSVQSWASARKGQAAL